MKYTTYLDWFTEDATSKAILNWLIWTEKETKKNRCCLFLFQLGISLSSHYADSIYLPDRIA